MTAPTDPAYEDDVALRQLFLRANAAGPDLADDGFALQVMDRIEQDYAAASQRLRKYVSWTAIAAGVVAGALVPFAIEPLRHVAAGVSAQAPIPLSGDISSSVLTMILLGTGTLAALISTGRRA